MQLKCNSSDKSGKDIKNAQDKNCHKKLSVDVEICAFCLDTKRDPVQLECKHSYCRTCLELYCQARSWQANRCPLCRCTLGPQPIQRRNNWRLKIMLLLVLVLLSYGPFHLLLNYW
ncbi:E3 ubiquitin-protein ligase RNF146-A [Drosophila innubila]|uniref:E3 ubiquitin-protein ligase RNF146-A n=1 Tax=Drosophila innubila TaxID=198719 RepID=UPI00148CE882|nr:E3 ubiquitin-protein ligase RNF146-A [Drosophila innubila]